jgi:hypothetical protein
VSATAGDALGALVDKMGVTAGVVVQELGRDTDCDDALAAALAERAGDDLVDADYDGVVDVVVLWWREGDGDLVDALVDALTPLTDEGVIWLLTPKAGRDGHVEPSDISESAPTAGLQQTGTVSAGADWNGARLGSPRSGRSRR